MRGVLSYLNERFQPAVALILAIATSLFLSGISAPNHAWQTKVGQTLAITLTVLAFLLRTRVTDEFKDRSHDEANYPNRPLQRGLISSHQLKWMGVVALVAELIGVVLLGVVSQNPMGMAWYFPVLIYSFFTSREFFASNYLEQHFTLYFVLHQVIFVWFAIWVLGATHSLSELPLAAPAIVGFVFALASVEVIRKFEVRENHAGQIVEDTYVTVWGLTRATGTLIFLFSAAGILLAISSISWLPVIAAVMLAPLVWLRRKEPKFVQAAVFVNFLVLAGIAWWR